LEFSKARQEKVEVSETDTTLDISVSFRVFNSRRPSVLRAVAQTDARLLLIRGLTKYIEVPSTHELVLRNLQMSAVSVENGFATSQARITRANVEVLPRRSAVIADNSSPVKEPAINSVEGIKDEIAATGSGGDGLPQLSRKGPVIISKDILDKAPKVPGLRSEAMHEYLNRIEMTFANLRTQFPRVLEERQYSALLRSAGDDVSELAGIFNKESSEDIRLTHEEMRSIAERVEGEVRKAYEQLDSVKLN